MNQALAWFGATFALGLALLGCSPSLRDGAYSCTNGACPEGWICGGDAHCHRTAGASGAGGSSGDGGSSADGGNGSDAGDAGSAGTGGSGGDGGSAGDGGAAGTGGSSGSGGSGGSGGSAGSGGSGGGETYAGCDSSAQCADGAECGFGPDGMADDGQCTAECDAGTSCPPGGKCIQGQCLGACSQSSECLAPLLCLHMPTGNMMGEDACFEVTNPALLARDDCKPMAGPTCTVPAICIFQPDYDMTAGVCSMNCMTSGECPAGNDCVQVFKGGLKHCLAPCGSNLDCTAPLMCGQFAGQHCVPPGWFDDAPLDDPPPM